MITMLFFFIRHFSLTLLFSLWGESGVRKERNLAMKLSGVLPPITTPFQDGKLAVDKPKMNFQKWNDTSLSGYLVLGSNGEVVYLNEKEKMEIIEASRESIPASKVLMVGTGMESTRETIQFTNQAARTGADCALVVTPSYFKGSMKPEILRDHFVAVAESSKIGILLYNVPQFTGVNLEPELVAKLSELYRDIVPDLPLVGTLGAWTPHTVMYSVPRAGQMGFMQRTEYSKQILKIGEKGVEITPKGGFIRYGIVGGGFGSKNNIQADHITAVASLYTNVSP
jgi:uncharacterized protein YifN (PemK superfamily)